MRGFEGEDSCLEARVWEAAFGVAIRFQVSSVSISEALRCSISEAPWERRGEEMSVLRFPVVFCASCIFL